jgi:hypothetical protein
MEKCSSIEIPGWAPSWACCECRNKTGYSTANGNQRDECKECGHKRCNAPAVKSVAFETENGITIVQTKTDTRQHN